MSGAGKDIVITFVVPVRHQANAKDWTRLTMNLTQTARSIAAQTDPRWEAVVVANHGATLPTLPVGFTVERVGLPPNPQYDKLSGPLEDVYEAVRLDKGRRILAGLFAMRPTGHVMVVDDDDFVSNRITGFVAQRRSDHGWWVQNGYLWSEGGRVVVRQPNFSYLCGTSHIVRADLLALPAEIDAVPEPFIKRMLGSHVFISAELAKRGTELAPLPFPGAIYRVGHAGAHSQSSSLRHSLLSTKALRQPKQTLRLMSRLRWLTASMRQEFFGR